MELHLEIAFAEVKRSLLKIDKALLLAVLVLLICKFILSWISFRRSVPPGPLLNLPFVGYLPFLGPNPYKTIWNMRNKYGHMMSIYLGPNFTVVLNDFKLAKSILSHPAALDRSPNIFKHIPENGFLTANGQPWVEQRRFSMWAARDLGLGRGLWENMIFAEVANFIKDLHDTKGQPTDISRMMGGSIASNIISLLVGRSLGKGERDEIDNALVFSELSLLYTGSTSPATLIPGLRKAFETLKVSGYHKVAASTKRFFKFLNTEVVRHKMSFESQTEKDFINLYYEKWSEINDTKNGKHSFSDGMLLGNLSTLFLGSSDTIFNSMVFLIRLMAKHQDVQEKVHEELMRVLGLNQKASWIKREEIPYTYAVLLELQRFASIVPFPPSRRVNQTFEYDGYVIPKGADILTNIWGMHHDPDYWNDPDLFLPERFIKVDGSKMNPNTPGYAAFSIGRRDCPGRTVAEMEILAYFTEVVKNFHVTVESGKEVEFKINHGLVQTLDPQHLCFTRRKIEN